VAGFSGSIAIANNVTSGSAMHDRASAPAGMSLSGNQLATDARLVAPPSDFRLRSGSPAIDAGQTLAYVGADHDGRARPQGSAFDVGAFEFVAR
jgi:hypothetical protein